MVFDRSLQPNSYSVLRLCIGNEKNHLAEFLSFIMNTDRLDEFDWNYLKDAKLWESFRIIFTLSHGQPAVERGFSVNSKLLVENLQEKTVVSSCFVYSSVKSDANHFSELSFTLD